VGWRGRKKDWRTKREENAFKMVSDSDRACMEGGAGKRKDAFAGEPVRKRRILYKVKEFGNYGYRYKGRHTIHGVSKAAK